MNLIDRVKNILVTPKTEWNVIDGESATPQSLLMTYVLPLAIVAAIGPILTGFLFAGVLGLTFFLITAVIAFISVILGYYISIYIVDLLAPSFGSEKDLNKSAQLVAYSATPSYVAGFLSFIPVIGGLLKFAAWVYSIYIMYLGLAPLKKTPEDKKVIYLLVAFLVVFGVTLLIGAILGGILFATMGLGAMRTMGV
jgi:Yip1 domain